jgi:hypothetical protein
MSLTEVSAYALAFGLFGVAWLLVVASNVIWYRVLVKLRTQHTARWEALGSPTIFGRNRASLRDASAWLLSEDSAQLGDMPLIRKARLARRMAYVGGALFLIWVGLWIWSVF